MTRAAVAAALDEIATLLALKGENDFRTRAYSTAARVLETLDGDLPAMLADGRLARVRGLGSGMTEKVVEMVAMGRLAYLDELRASVPPGLIELLRVNGLGPKKAKGLYDVLGIDSLPALKAACEQNRVAAVKGFGEKTQAKLLAAVSYLGRTAGRVRLDKALPVGTSLRDRVRELPGVAFAELCGSVRRRLETAGNLNLVVATDQPSDVLSAVTALPGIRLDSRTADTAEGVVEHTVGDRVVRVAFDLRCVPPDRFASAVLDRTGSPAHLQRLKERATARGIDLGSVPGADEPAIYHALGLNWVPPELREDAGEVELAAAGELPELIEPVDVRGVFHNHTTASDGYNTLEEMARAAQALGYQYLGIGDHSQSLQVANGLTPGRVRQQWQEIDRLNARLDGLRVLKGTECDILPDGSLDFDDDLLAGFDYVVASVHTHFALSEADQTARVCKALAHPRVTMLGHATGRLLLRRDAYPIDLDAVVRCAAEHGKMIEINAQPNRLDLPTDHCRVAKALGVPLVINPDAHDTAGLGLVPWGVMVARRAGLTRADVFNTRPLAAVLAELSRRKAVDWGIDLSTRTPLPNPTGRGY